MSNFFITLEGIEGAGKSTVTKAISDWLDSQGIRHLCAREPGGTKGGEAIRRMLLETDVELCPEAELFLLEAARAQLMQEVVIPTLSAGQGVVLDRHTDSTLAYQGYGRGIDREQIQRMNEVACRGWVPNCTLVLDIDPHIGLARAKRSNPQEPDRFEREAMAFMEKVRSGFLDLARQDPARYCVLDAGRDQETVVQEAVRTLSQHLPTLPAKFD